MPKIDLSDSELFYTLNSVKKALKNFQFEKRQFESFANESEITPENKEILITFDSVEKELISLINKLDV